MEWCARGAYEADFKCLGATPCSKGDQTACLLYEFSGSAYTGPMVVRPASAGWERVDPAPEATPP